jgi:hypothetical protein
MPDKRFDDLAVVCEIGVDEPGPGVWWDTVDVHHRPVLLDQCCYDGAAELAAAAGDCNCPTHVVLLNVVEGLSERWW